MHLVSNCFAVTSDAYKTTAPALVAVRQLRFRRVKDTIDESEVVLDLLIALDVKAILGFVDGRLHVRHDEGLVEIEAGELGATLDKLG